MINCMSLGIGHTCPSINSKVSCHLCDCIQHFFCVISRDISTGHGRTISIWLCMTKKSFFLYLNSSTYKMRRKTSISACHNILYPYDSICFFLIVFHMPCFRFIYVTIAKTNIRSIRKYDTEIFGDSITFNVVSCCCNLNILILLLLYLFLCQSPTLFHMRNRDSEGYTITEFLLHRSPSLSQIPIAALLLIYIHAARKRLFCLDSLP